MVVPVLVPIPTPVAYSYSAPSDWNLRPGDIVQVPLGPRQVAGIVWDPPEIADPVDPKKLRTVTQKFQSPPVNAVMRRFVDWVANYTLSPPGMVAKMVLRVPAAFDPEPPTPALVWRGKQPDRLTDARRRVIALAGEMLDEGPIPWTRLGLAKAAGSSASVVDGLIKQDLFEEVLLPPRPVVARPDPHFGSLALSSSQQEAGDRLRKSVMTQSFDVTLLDGVTGSGKTEVYFEAVAAALEQGKQVLILLPEIALTQVFLERFEKRFGAPPAPWHSDLAPRQRERVWRQVAAGDLRVVAGARSALFLPFADLGLIIVDEEHDSAYKQEDRITYHARDMAVVRGHLGGHAVVLASATPSIESQVNAEHGRYHKIVLRERQGDAVLPTLKAIDMRKSRPAPGGFISPALLEAVGGALERKEQALLFLNRRGYAPLTLCRACGHRFECNNCSAWLVEHRFRGTLNCHHCGHHEVKPESCPKCGTLDYLVPCGPGVERLAEEVDGHFPDARILVLSSDLLGGVSRLRLELEAVAKGEADIIIGTQMVAKGHNFPLLSLVGVVDADIGLAGGDPRAAERTFQLLTQVTGRAGRYGRKSLGLIQSYQPDHPVVRAIISGDRDAFYEQEIDGRRRGTLPPFGRLAAIIISANSKAEAEAHGRAMARAAPRDAGISLLGPAEAPMALIRGRHRFRLLAHGDRNQDMQAYLRGLLAASPNPRGSVRVAVDVDPQSFL